MRKSAKPTCVASGRRGMSQIDDLPPLREVVQRHGLLAKKSLGQNFLFDLNLTSRIARASGPPEGVTIVEVGPGPGGLTRALLAAGAARVIAIERDARCLPALAEIAAHYPGRLEIVEADALAFDPRPLVGDDPARIVANLPYNVGTALLTNWLTTEPWPPWWQSLTLMFQREVAERIVADERDRRNYGRLGVLCGWRSQTRILFDVPPSAFVPPPKITSSVVQLTPRADPLPCRVEALETVTRAAFGQRRKMLRQSVKSITPAPLELTAAAGLPATARAEDVPVAGFVALANALDAQRGAVTPVSPEVRR
jgi:16S rRNA (adenine1518-N6/adenine1519-N6)-dimethyltransferase